MSREPPPTAGLRAGGVFEFDRRPFRALLAQWRLIMTRNWLAIILTLIAATVLGAGGSALFFDNFDDGDAAGWDQNDFTGIGIYDASSGAYVIESPIPIPVDDPSVGTMESHWVRSIDSAKFSNGTMRGTIRANTDGTTMGFLLRDK